MKNKGFNSIFLLVILLLFPKITSGEVVLSENFDNWPDYYADQYPPSPWCDSCGSNGLIQSLTIDNETHSTTEVTSPGRGGLGKSLKTWRNGMAWVGNTYYGSLGLRPIEGHSNHNALYFRWYMKVPTSFVFQNDGQKMFRYNISDGGEIYFNFYETNLRMCPNSGGPDCLEQDLAPKADWHDGEWHAHQLYINLETSTVTYWLDSIQTYHKVGVVNMPSTSATFGTENNFIQHFPFGNSFNEPYPSSWQAFEVDDLVIATTKAETDPDTGDMILPSAPTGLIVF